MTTTDAHAGASEDIRTMVQVFNSESKAFESIRKDALGNGSYSQYLLAILYFTGTGTNVDINEGIKWLRMSATNGNTEARRDLGKIYIMGKYAPQNFTEAVKWLKLASEQLDPSSMHTLGMMYEHGSGVKKDILQSYVWYNLAASHGNSDAVKSRTDISKIMSVLQISKAQKLSEALNTKYINAIKSKEESKYAQQPLKVDMDVLPKDYHGHNFRNICLALNDKKLLNDKNKIESDKNYRDRITKLVNETFIAKLKLGDTLAIEDVLYEVRNKEYNDSKKLLEISIPLKKPDDEIDMPKDYMQTIIDFKMEVIFNKDGKESTFGGFSHGLIFNNYDSINIDETNGIAFMKLKLRVEPIIANEIIGNKHIGLLYITKIKYPFSFIHKNTKSNNTDVKYYMVVSVIECWIYDKNTGKIIAKSKLEPKDETIVN